MSGLGDQAARDAEQLARVATAFTQGVCEAIDWTNGLARVNVNGTTVPMPMVGHPPAVGFKVWVATIAEQPVALGIVARAARGTVTVAAAGGYVGVLGDDGVTYSLPYLDAAPALSSRVVISWTDGGTVLGVSSAEPIGVVPVLPPSGAATIKSFRFVPKASRNWYNGAGYTNGSSGSEVWCSSSNEGVLVYGSTIPNSIPDDAEYVPGSLRIYLVETSNQYPSSLARLGMHNLSSLSGAPGTTNLITIPDCRGGRWVDLPASWEDNFRLGTKRGVAFAAGPGFHRYRPGGVENSGVIVGKWKVN